MPGDTLRLDKHGSDSLIVKDTFQSKQIILIESKQNKTKLLGIEMDLWAIFLIPILSFLLGLLINSIIQKIKIKRSLKQNETFLFTWINLIEPQVSKQATSLKSLSEQLKSVDNVPLELQNHNLHIDKLKKIDSPTLLSTFVTNKRGLAEKKNKLIFELENKIAFLGNIQETISETTEVYKNIGTENSKAWESNILDVQKIIRIILENKQALSLNNFYSDVMKYYHQWTTSKTPATSKTATKELFLKKIEPICQEYLVTNNKDTLAFELLEKTQMLLHVFDRITACYVLTSKRLSKSAQDIVEEYKELKRVKDELEKLIFRPLLFIK